MFVANRKLETHRNDVCTNPTSNVLPRPLVVLTTGHYLNLITHRTKVPAKRSEIETRPQDYEKHINSRFAGQRDNRLVPRYKYGRHHVPTRIGQAIDYIRDFAEIIIKDRGRLLDGKDIGERGAVGIR
jgi:hypothetical protein